GAGRAHRGPPGRPPASDGARGGGPSPEPPEGDRVAPVPGRRGVPPVQGRPAGAGGLPAGDPPGRGRSGRPGAPPVHLRRSVGAAPGGGRPPAAPEPPRHVP